MERCQVILYHKVLEPLTLGMKLKSLTTFLPKDVYYFRGFEEDVMICSQTTISNYQAWCFEFAPMMVGNMESMVIQEFNGMLFNRRPYITLSVANS